MDTTSSFDFNMTQVLYLVYRKINILGKANVIFALSV